MKKTTLLPFIGNEDKCVSGVTELKIVTAGKRTYIGHSGNELCYEFGGGLIVCRKSEASIIHETEPQYVPHDCESCPVGAVVRNLTNDTRYVITAAMSDGAALNSSTVSYGHLLLCHVLDGTDIPCGKEIDPAAKGDK